MNKSKIILVGAIKLVAILLAFNIPTQAMGNKPAPLLYLKNSIRVIPGFPHAGINFFDITTVLDDPIAFQICIDNLESRYRKTIDTIDAIVALDARGFIFGAALADRLKKPLALVRKTGKLPAEKFQVKYTKEYGDDTFELHKSSIKPGYKVIVIDDLIATGGTVEAAIKLVKMAGGTVTEVAAIIDIPELKGREKIKAPVYTVLQLNEK